MAALKQPVYFDTSVLIAGLVAQHPRHASAEPLLNQTIKSARHQAVISAHGLAEIYSVLTRAPEPIHLHPAEAWRILELSILPAFDVVSLSAGEYLSLLAECAHAGLGGGAVYDMLHLYAARKAQCRRLYTFNVRHFRELSPQDWQDRIVSP